MVGRWNVLLGRPIFRGYISFRECNGWKKTNQTCHVFFFSLCKKNRCPKLDHISVGGSNAFEKYYSKWVHLPQIGVNIENIWNHHPDIMVHENPAATPGVCFQNILFIINPTESNAKRAPGFGRSIHRNPNHSKVVTGHVYSFTSLGHFSTTCYPQLRNDSRNVSMHKIKYYMHLSRDTTRLSLKGRKLPTATLNLTFRWMFFVASKHRRLRWWFQKRCLSCQKDDRSV